MLYVLDTCILSYLDDPDSPFNSNVLANLQSLRDSDEVCLSILSFYELEYGLRHGAGRMATELEDAKRLSLQLYPALPLSRDGASIFAEIKSRYRQHYDEQRPAKKELSRHLARHTVDFILASTAIEYGGIVVSNDHIFETLRELMPTLTVDDWTVAPNPPPGAS